MYRAEGFREAKPCQRQRACQHQDRQHGATQRAHGDADRPIAEAQSQCSDQGNLENAQPLQGFQATSSPRVQAIHWPSRSGSLMGAMTATGQSQTSRWPASAATRWRVSLWPAPTMSRARPLLVAPAGVSDAWIGQVTAGWSFSKPWRGRPSRIWLASDRLSRTNASTATGRPRQRPSCRGSRRSTKRCCLS